ncbi:MAG: hypothetical protein V4671_07955 [Armatimonadota bacterium]
MITPPLPTISAPRRSRLRLWLTLIGVFAFIVLGTMLTLLYRIGKRFDKEYAPVAATLPAELASAKKEGLPTTLAEMRPNPPVSTTENAAPLYRKMTALYKKESGGDTEKAFFEAHPEVLKETPRSTKDDQAIREFLQTRAAFLQITEQAAQKPRCDFARDWSGGLDVAFPEYPVMRASARLLMLRAALLSDENQPGLALQDVARAANIARHTGSDPTVINALVKIAIQTIAHRRFIEILQRHGADPAVLPAAREAAKALSDPIDVRRAFSGEMVLAGETFKEIRNSPDFTERMRRQGLRIPTSNPQVQQQIADAWQSRSVAYWRKFHSRLSASGGDMLAFEKALKSIQDEEDTNRFAPGYEMNAILTYVFLEMPSKLMQAQASNHLRQEMLGLLEYKQKTGAFPEALNDLPKTTVRTDPFTNQPLKYKKMDNGFVLYSVGNNRKDDGGSKKSIKQGNSNRPEDIVVSYP